MKKNLLYILYVCVFPFWGWAQNPQDGETDIEFQLSSLIAKGLKQNYGLKIVKIQEQIATNDATRANAGFLPTLNATAGYSGSVSSNNTTPRADGSVQKTRNVADHQLQVGVDLDWMVFDGFKMQANYQRLAELKKQSQTQTRIAVEDYVSQLTAEYYNFIRQRIRLRNLRQAVALSKERLRIVLERYSIGSASRLDLRQAQVDFNADSAQSLKQHELLATSRIRLHELMATDDVRTPLNVADTAIDVCDDLNFEDLRERTLQNNTSLLQADHNRALAAADYRSVCSRDYPYFKLFAGYGVNQQFYGSGNASRRTAWGPDFGVTVGMKLFDGNRSRERRNARLQIEKAEYGRRDAEQALQADLSDLWQAYQNNLRLLLLERENLITARENHYIACERFMLGDLSGIEMREAQQSLLDAEERILEAEYNTKLCEISLRQISGTVMNYAAD